MLRTCNDTDGSKLMIFSGIAFGPSGYLCVVATLEIASVTVRAFSFVENRLSYLGCIHPIQDLLDENVRSIGFVDSAGNQDP